MNNSPHGWKLIEIGSFCQTASGGTPSRAHPEFFKGDIPWVKISDMKDWIITDTAEKLTESALQNSSAKVFPQNTVLVSIFATIGAVAILGAEAATNQAIAGVIPDPRVANYRYLAHYLAYIRPQLVSMSRGIAQKNINQRILRSIKVMLPPMRTQRLIANVLDRAKALQQRREQANRFASKITGSVFQKIFGDPTTNPMGWQVVKLISVCEKITDGTHKTPKYVPSGVPFLSVKNIVNGYLDFADTRFISKEEHTALTKRCKPEFGDILYTKVGVNFGRATIVDTRKEFSIFVSVALLKPKSELIDSRFLASCLNSEFMKSQARRRVRGIGVPDLHLKEIRDFDIILPPLEIQQKFSRIVKKIESLKMRQKKSTAEINDLFSSIMDKAFRGELTSKEVDKESNKNYDPRQMHRRSFTLDDFIDETNEKR